MKTVKILVQGIVQGVGFRPNVYRIAIKNNIKGYVKNLGNIVEIIGKGDEKDIEKFIEEIESKKPPVSVINSLKLEYINKINELNYYGDYGDYGDFDDFKILESSSELSGTSVIPPDLSVCDNCLKEMRNPNNRRYKHPFIACTDCGPRFSVIEAIPYDRIRTTMNKFPLCGECEKEYTNPNDRRYHGEAISCHTCGPELTLLDNEKRIIKKNNENPIKTAATLLNKGKILAIKGIGGTHLVAKVSDDKVVKKLRNILGRENQAFAVMVKDIETGRSFAEISKKEEECLKNIERPIVVVKKSKNYNLSEYVSPLLHNIGIMLPYTPIHYLLFDYIENPGLIMTSANIPGEPMMITNEEIAKNLKHIADYFLIHNREIINRCDDSVIRYINNQPSFIRRSRGFTPTPYDLNLVIPDNSKNKNILALGPELDVTFTILKEKMAYMSQHIGNTNKFKTYEFLQDAIKHISNITSTNSFDAIACDLHPQFFTSKLAKELAEQFKCETIPIQHHHAHGAVLAADNNIEELIVIAADGVGYGDDKTAWGGEILYTDIGSYERMASLSSQKLPGGDISTKYPVRAMTAMLYNQFETNQLKTILNENYLQYFKHGEIEINMVLKQLENNLNVSTTTSTGRVLDSISVALGICGKRTYEGEASMKLESVASKSNNNKINIKNSFIKENGLIRLDTSKILKNVLDLIKNGENKKDIAKAGQSAVANGLAELAILSANKKNIDVIGGTGGVFYNQAISKIVKEKVEKEGLKYVQHKNSCPGDGSVSLGQAIIASRII
ncbi:MAG: carbamoyltransferase HypF [Methanobrevibacter sp.]|jgi:hydrogenase maturation protein HypF|nr:carbamoyltransferase HypF [Candidatus Methanoflexus mossambicus]